MAYSIFLPPKKKGGSFEIFCMLLVLTLEGVSEWIAAYIFSSSKW
jgi:hypothetical protein